MVSVDIEPIVAGWLLLDDDDSDDKEGLLLGFFSVATLNSAGRRESFKWVNGESAVCDDRISLILRRSFFINMLKRTK